MKELFSLIFSTVLLCPILVNAQSTGTTPKIIGPLVFNFAGPVGMACAPSPTATPSQQLEATVKSLCTGNCNAAVPADNPSSRLQATIKVLNPNASALVPADNPSARLEAAIMALQAR